MTKACWLRMYCDCHIRMNSSICFYLFNPCEYDSVDLIFYLKCMFVSVSLSLRYCTCDGHDSSWEQMMSYQQIRSFTTEGPGVLVASISTLSCIDLVLIEDSN